MATRERGHVFAPNPGHLGMSIGGYRSEAMAIPAARGPGPASPWRILLARLGYGDRTRRANGFIRGPSLPRDQEGLSFGGLPMTTDSFSKSQRKELRRLAGLAHERELSAATAELQSQFERWRRGEIDVFALNEKIHEFHDGVSRQLYQQYVLGEISWNVASALAHEVLQESEVDPAIVALLRGSMDTARSLGRENDED